MRATIAFTTSDEADLDDHARGSDELLAPEALADLFHLPAHAGLGPEAEVRRIRAALTAVDRRWRDLAPGPSLHVGWPG